jgi:glycosyltransferase involved in cell wall biosynthesis
MAPSFSVVTPSFGQLSWLQLCIASVADQQGAGCIEHIVCDAGSAGIEHFLRQMHGRHPDRPGYRLRFEVGPDRGMYDAINKGLRLAAGEVCCYLNCDEQLLPGALAAAGGRFAAAPSVDVIFGDALVVDAGGKALCYWRPYVPTLRHLSGAKLNTLSCSTFFRRRVVEAGHLFDPDWKVVGDLLWIRGLLEAGRSMGSLREPLAAFTFLGANLGASTTAEEEFRKTRTASGPGRRLVRRALHGARKVLSGAYLRRRVTYDVFTTGDPLRRTRFRADALGWKWPSVPFGQDHG